MLSSIFQRILPGLSKGFIDLPKNTLFINPAMGIVSPIRTFKLKTSLRLRCPECYFARRGGRLYVRCKAEPRHKQRQGRATRKQQVF